MAFWGMGTAERERPLAPTASRSRAVRPASTERRIVEGRITALFADDKQGTVRLRGRDVTTRGSRVTPVQGGTVRIN